MAKLGAYLIVIILLALPLHALLSVVLGNFVGYDGAKLWKEYLLLLLGLPAGWLLWRDRSMFRRLCAWPIAWLVGLYAGLHLALGLYTLARGNADLTAVLYGGLVNLRFLWFFLVSLIIAAHVSWLRAHWQQLLFWPAAVVVGLGLLQLFVLPNDFLAHIGYGPETIPAYQTVDQKEDLVRVQSSLRGPNPLGAYLIVVIAACLAVVLSKKGTYNLWLGVLLAGSIVVLAATYSRSAYIGAFVAGGLVVWLTMHSRRARRWCMLVAFALILCGAAATYLLRDHNLLQNVLFHTDETSQSATSSNAVRTAALTSGLREVASEPLGRGPGTAGPASVYNSAGGVRLAENYYLQIGQEVGWLGIGLLAGILIAAGLRLYQRRTDLLAVSLFASLVGISIVNMISHAWTDDTLSLLWWGLAGIALVPAILKHTNNETS